MSMLNSVKIKKKTELKLLWESFEKFVKLLKHEMIITKKFNVC